MSVADLTDAADQLVSRFSNPLEGAALRRIVIWHDAEGSFEGAFDQLALSGIASSRPVHCVKVGEGSAFSLKRQVYRLRANDDFLIYSRTQKDFSPKGLEGNWLADVEFIAEHFQADFNSLLLEELGADDAAREGVERFGAFFRAAERKGRFKRLMPAARSAGDVTLGVIGSVLGADDLSAERLLRMFLCQLEAGKDPLGKLAKYGASEAFASLARGLAGYEGDLADADSLAAHVLLTAASEQLPEDPLGGLEAHISQPHGQFCLNVVHDWMADESSVSALYDACRRVEARFNLGQRFGRVTPEQLMEADVFPCVNECLLVNLLDAMGQGADRANEAARVARRRKDLRWFSRVRPYYAALEAIVAARRFYVGHAQGFHLAVPVDVWKAYTSDWFCMDAAYRSFCNAFDGCRRVLAEVPAALDESLDCASEWMENIYVNWFLPGVNECWVNASQGAWEQDGYVQDVARQRRFFDEQVLSGASGVKRTMVIVSDALRYEVAVELSDRLERDTKGTAELESMQAVFPSVTEFGMAALLPHASMSYSWEDGGVFLDDEHLPTGSLLDRQLVLQRRKPKSRCLRSKDLMAAKRGECKELVGDAEFVYVYHNGIDSIGESYFNEHRVFQACDSTLDELVALVKRATADLGFTRILITADHGFLYTRAALREHDKVSGASLPAESVKLGRRYAISNGAALEGSLFVKMNMSDIRGGEYTGLAARECVRIKRPGAGERYVHGGVSLQECCVPVIRFRNRRAGSKGYEERSFAELKLLSTSRRVTSMIFGVDLFQKEPVCGKVLPAEYELFVADASGAVVSDVRRAHADMASPDERERVSRVRFALKSGRAYSPSQTHYLVCRNKDTGQDAWEEEFQIDIAFAPLDDFGF